MRNALLVLWLVLAGQANAETPPDRTLEFTAREGTWMHPDVSPDGRTILFDLLGDIYAVDAGGGTARPLLTGTPFESQPVFSPDGSHIAFISDRSGITNLWVAKADGSEPRMLSRETSLNVMTSPSWSVDGRTVHVSRMVHSLLVFEIWAFDLDGAPGVQLTKAGSETWDERHNAVGPVASPDGRSLYYAVKQGHTWTIKDPPVWSVVRRDMKTGAEQTVVQGAGGAMSPALSGDGRTLAYAARDGRRTVIRLRTLDTGEDRLLAPIDHDGQEGGYYAGLTPRFRFSPDDRSILLSVDGGLALLAIETGARTDIPFSADVRLTIGPDTHMSIPEETGPVLVRVIQSPRLSPDGARFVFTALGGLYVQDTAGGPTRRLIEAGDLAFQPSWSPDGRTLAYITWSAATGGAIWTIPADGGAPTRLTTAPAFYTEPVFTPDGATIAALRASGYDRIHALSEISPLRQTDVIRLPVGGGVETLVAPVFGARFLDVASDGRRLRVYSPGGVASMPVEGGEPRIDFVAVGQSPSQYVGAPIAADEVRLNPTGDKALVRQASQVWLVDVPARQGDQPPKVDLTAPPADAVRLTRVGADFMGWADDGRTIAWSVGSTLHTVPLAQAGENAEAQATPVPAVVTLPRDVPTGVVILRGGTALTMRGKEVIEDADVVVVDNRIAAVGRRGAVAIPDGALIRDVRGKVLIPGLVDAHTHWFAIRRPVHEVGHWEFLANLAFGVTSTLEVQAFTSDIFAYQDMIDAGRMPGPRAWSTGAGIFRNSPNATDVDIAAVLSRYRDNYRTRNVKAYMVGDRETRRRTARVLAEQGMMATTEGASDLNLNLTHFIDGFAGNEHALPVTPIRDDVVRLMADSGTSYTPTLSVLYGGWPALFQQTIKERPQDDPRVQQFFPAEMIAEKLRDRHWAPEEQQTYARFAADALRVQRAGGLVGMGSHSEMQGLGMHWEMAAYASGGATPMEALYAATMGSARAIGRSGEVGSLEPGKFADILILDADPRDDISNSRKIHWVMKNGRLYNPATLQEVGGAPSAGSMNGRELR